MTQLPIKEKDIVRSILDYLEFRKIFHWRNNTGATIITRQSGKKDFYRFGAVGSPDIFAVIDGKIYGIEVKTLTGVQSENQKLWQKDFEKAGGIYLLIRSLDELIKVL